MDDKMSLWGKVGKNFVDRKSFVRAFQRASTFNFCNDSIRYGEGEERENDGEKEAQA